MEYVSYTDGKIPSVKLLNLVVNVGVVEYHQWRYVGSPLFFSFMCWNASLTHLGRLADDQTITLLIQTSINLLLFVRSYRSYQTRSQGTSEVLGSFLWHSLRTLVFIFFIYIYVCVCVCVCVCGWRRLPEKIKVKYHELTEQKKGAFSSQTGLEINMWWLRQQDPPLLDFWILIIEDWNWVVEK
jgi:hypothetical protein